MVAGTTHSKVMAWVAFDRAIKSVEQFGFDAPVARWRKTRAEIHRQVCRHGYDASIERSCSTMEPPNSMPARCSSRLLASARQRWTRSSTVDATNAI